MLSNFDGDLYRNMIRRNSKRFSFGDVNILVLRKSYVVFGLRAVTVRVK
jgi:hypothetical protein